MEIVVNGRNSEISERFREHVQEKLHRIDKYDARQKIHRVEVEVTHEKNPRQHENAARVEMTLRSAGPAVRAEAASTDQHSALDAAIDKLESRLRRTNDRGASTTASTPAVARRRDRRSAGRVPRTTARRPRPSPNAPTAASSPRRLPRRRAGEDARGARR